jgi:hypothetical protein
VRPPVAGRRLVDPLSDFCWGKDGEAMEAASRRAPLQQGAVPGAVSPDRLEVGARAWHRLRVAGCDCVFDA